MSIFLIFLFLPCVFSQNKIFASKATELEVEYPVLATGAKITPTSELTEYLKYVFDFGMGIGFAAVIISLAWAGVLYFLSPAIPTALAKAKDRISGAISGLLILVLFYLIITTINPYLAIFKLGKLEPIELPPEAEKEIIGVTFYKSGGCTGESKTQTSSISDLGENFRNNISSVGINHDELNEVYYVSVLYDIANFWGKCQYVDPNRECSNVQPFASSASVHQYDFTPKGDGVYIYRKPFVKAEGKEKNGEGGYLKISNSQIADAGISILNLNELRFTGTSSDYDNIDHCTVPKTERDCAIYDKKGNCIEKKCPNLGDKNMSSINIAGDYLVLLVYFAPGDNPFGPWTYCQAYASNEDADKSGPENIKWDAVRSRNQNPNWMVIIPIKN